MYNQTLLQTTPSQPQISQAYYNQPHQSPYNLHFPQLKDKPDNNKSTTTTKTQSTKLP
jgi:hypothetical protein